MDVLKQYVVGGIAELYPRLRAEVTASDLCEDILRS